MVFSRTVQRWAPAPSVPSIPASVTSITKDAGATVSWLHPKDNGTSEFVISSYAGGSPGPVATVAATGAATITGSDGNTYLQAPITGLANSTAYTFTVKAANSHGFSPESAASGANTPLAGLVFGDDFNGAAAGPINPEWWVYTRCGFLAQNEVAYYLPSQCVLDGNGNLALTAVHTSHTGPSYPSAGGGTVTQPWISGACQSNTRTYAPTSGNTMTFEVRQQICADAGNGFWPGLFWLEGQNFLTQWKTDPAQPGWDTGSSAEIDVAEWSAGQTKTNYGVNVFGNTTSQQNVNTSTDFSAAMHVYQAQWKPGVSTKFFRDGVQTGSSVTASGTVATSAAQFFLLLYLQMLAGGPTTTESCLIDYVRVFDLP